MYPPRRWQWESHHDRGSASTTNPLQRLNEVRRWALASRVARVLSWRKRLGVLRILRKACFHPVAVQESQPIGRLAEPHAVVRFHAPDAQKAAVIDLLPELLGKRGRDPCHSFVLDGRAEQLTH